jgi:hypothetical protein
MSRALPHALRVMPGVTFRRMWLLFGAGTKHKQVKGGLRVERYCAKCATARTFVECEFDDKVEVFFVSVFDGKSRRLVCTECGDDVELDARAQAPAVAPAPRKNTLPSPRREVSEKEKDKLLAELKKKMSKS